MEWYGYCFQTTRVPKVKKLHSHDMALYAIKNTSNIVLKVKPSHFEKLRCGWKDIKVKQFKTRVKSIIEVN